MRAAATSPTRHPVKTMGGLIGGEAHAVAQSNAAGRGICDSQLARATAYALGVLETNASMGRIVAAPTAGSSGVILPRCLPCKIAAASMMLRYAMPW